MAREYRRLFHSGAISKLSRLACEMVIMTPDISSSSKLHELAEAVDEKSTFRRMVIEPTWREDDGSWSTSSISDCDNGTET